VSGRFLARLARFACAAAPKAADPAAGTLSAAELRSRIDRGDKLLVLDVRAAADYAGPGGHVPGAKNVPLEELPQRLHELDAWRDRPIAVLCRTNRRSGEAVRLLKQSGCRNALLVSDGMLAWERHRFPTEIRK